MFNGIIYCFACLLLSLYIFPFEFVALPGINTKMILAGIGVIAVAVKLAKERNSSILKDFISIVSLALAVSLIGFCSIVYNNTKDYTYVTYIVSMLVWLSAANVVLMCIRKIHKGISVELVCNYLIGVAVFQCISALVIDFIPYCKQLVNSIVLGVGFVADFKDIDGIRLYGIGAMLDVAGQRFSCILVMISFICIHSKSVYVKRYIGWYLFSFFFIAIVGNMISRTTTIGVLVSVLYWIYTLFTKSSEDLEHIKSFFKVGLPIFIVILIVSIYLYQTNSTIHNHIRFGFEGFFSIAEKGEWETNSTNILENMYRFPQSLKTWLIGDGYFENPTGDPLYTGYQWKGFYMGTDVGYLRFIYYFGLIGLLAFSCYFIKVLQICMMKFSKYRRLFFLILILNFIVWFKVSSDLFPIFALFLCINTAEDDSFDRRVCIIE